MIHQYLCYRRPYSEPYDTALTAACQWQEHAPARWSEYRRYGLTDDELQAVLCSEFGKAAGHYHSTDPLKCYTVRNTPRLIFICGEPDRPLITLTGKSLLRAVRRVMFMPDRNELQQRLL